jgi:hypothetical protein
VIKKTQNLPQGKAKSGNPIGTEAVSKPNDPMFKASNIHNEISDGGLST